MGAGQNFPCPGCGAELMWTPGAAGLTCEYCGHEVKSEAANQPYVATEHRLDQAATSAARGWGTEMQEFQCDACGAISEVDAKLTATLKKLEEQLDALAQKLKTLEERP